MAVTSAASCSELPPTARLNQDAILRALWTSFGSVNFLKGGLIYSDYLTTVSRKYAEEIQTSEFGFGLEGVVRMRARSLVGILNGVDYSAWSPERDTLIPAKYSAKNMAGKRACKDALLEELQLLRDNPNRPVLGIVSRFADQRGST